jgi:NADH:ubiquinone oxidoreductase subunit 6 (subunit J)
MKTAVLILVGVGTVGLIVTFVYMRRKLDQLERMRGGRQ